MTQLYRSYLFAYVMVLGVGLGCLGLLLLHRLVGGEWGKASRPVLQAGADTLPLLGVLYLPVLFGLSRIYPWTDAAHLLINAGHKQLYFGRTFFILRAVLYFLLWFWMARGQRKRAGMGKSALGLGLYVLSVSFASFDWIMSLEPNWSSSIYGVMLLIGNVLSALAFTLLVLHWRSRKGTPRLQVDEDTAHDLGNLLLGFVMLWAYMSLSQYLIIWSANLPEEIGWYLARQRGGWQWVAIVLIVFQFFLPLALLLARQRKRKLERLAVVAGGILFMRVIDVFWLTVPDFTPGRFSIHAWDLVILVVLGGTWIFVFQGFIARRISDEL